MRQTSILALIAIAMMSGIGPASAEAENGARTLLGNSDKSVLLSPTPLGPLKRLDRPRVVAKTDAVKPPPTRQTSAAATRITGAKATALKRPARANVLNAYARDVRRQSWPCAGDGICAWTQPR